MLLNLVIGWLAQIKIQSNKLISIVVSKINMEKRSNLPYRASVWRLESCGSWRYLPSCACLSESACSSAAPDSPRDTQGYHQVSSPWLSRWRKECACATSWWQCRECSRRPTPPRAFRVHSKLFFWLRHPSTIVSYLTLSCQMSQVFPEQTRWRCFSFWGPSQPDGRFCSAKSAGKPCGIFDCSRPPCIYKALSECAFSNAPANFRWKWIVFGRKYTRKVCSRCEFANAPLNLIGYRIFYRKSSSLEAASRHLACLRNCCIQQLQDRPEPFSKGPHQDDGWTDPFSLNELTSHSSWMPRSQSKCKWK